MHPLEKWANQWKNKQQVKENTQKERAELMIGWITVFQNKCMTNAWLNGHIGNEHPHEWMTEGHMSGSVTERTHEWQLGKISDWTSGRKRKKGGRKEWMNACAHEWMHEWITQWMNDWMTKRMNEWMHACMHAWMNGWMDEWINGGMNESMKEGRKKGRNEGMNHLMNDRIKEWMTCSTQAWK